MDPNIYKYFLKDFIHLLKENERDLKEKLMFADSEEKNYILGRLFSYKEVFEILKSVTSEHQIDLKDL